MKPGDIVSYNGRRGVVEGVALPGYYDVKFGPGDVRSIRKNLLSPASTKSPTSSTTPSSVDLFDITPNQLSKMLSDPRLMQFLVEPTNLEMLGVSESTLFGWMRGAFRPSPPEKQRLMELISMYRGPALARSHLNPQLNQASATSITPPAEITHSAHEPEKSIGTVEGSQDPSLFREERYVQAGTSNYRVCVEEREPGVFVSSCSELELEYQGGNSPVSSLIGLKNLIVSGEKETTVVAESVPQQPSSPVVTSTPDKPANEEVKGVKVWARTAELLRD